MPKNEIFLMHRRLKPKRVRPVSSKKGKGTVDIREIGILITFSVLFWVIIVGVAGYVEYYITEPILFLGIPWLLNGTTIYFAGVIIWAFIDVLLIKKFKRS